MSRPQPSTIAIWISVAGFCLTIGVVVFASGGEKQRLDALQSLSHDHEQRIRSLEKDRSASAVMEQRIEEMSRKVDQLYNRLILQRTDQH